MSKGYVSWEEFHAIMDKAGEVLSALPPFYMIIGVARGGMIPAQILAYQLNISRLHSLGLKSYTRDEWSAQEDRIEVYQDIHCTPPPEKNLDLPILLVDDITDTGHTTEFAVSQLKYQHGYSNIYTYSVFWKKGCPVKVNLFGQEVEHGTWIVFPWDAE